MALRVGVIGCGVMGADHVRTISTWVSAAEVAAVADPDRERADAVAAGAGVEHVFTDPAALIADPVVDAVLVASPDDTHEELVLACLEAGKPVLCEKPLATTAEGCLRIIQAEVAAGRRLVEVAFMRRFDPGYTQLKRIADEGSIGPALMLHCVHRNASYPPHLGSEALITSTAVHEIDIARWLLGQEFAHVTAHVPRRSSLVRDDLQDPLFLVLMTDQGVLVDVEAFVNAGYGYDVRCELVGEQGSITLPSPTAPAVRRDGARSRGLLEDFRPHFAAAYRIQLQTWASAAAKGEPAGVSAWDGYAAMAVADACVASLRSGTGQAVQLEPRPPLYA